MSPAERLLDHLDGIAKSEPRLVRISHECGIYIAVYRGFPKQGAVTGFTFGLSHSHPMGGAHKELTVSMCDDDNAWAIACGYVAVRLRERCPFVCGDTIDFGTPIAASSTMSAFVAIHPRHISPANRVIDLGERRIELVQLLPLYESERQWLMDGGELKSLLEHCAGSVLMDPRRKPFAGKAM